MRIRFAPSCMALRARTTESLQYCTMYFASCKSDRPAAVSASPLCVRSNSRTSRLSSSRLICLMTAVGVIYICSAARWKLPASATRRNVSSCGPPYHRKPNRICGNHKPTTIYNESIAQAKSHLLMKDSLSTLRDGEQGIKVTLLFHQFFKGTLL